MILLSSIIEAFEKSFFKKYKTAIGPSYKKALRAMKRCRKEYGPRMLARCTNDNCRKYTFMILTMGTTPMTAGIWNEGTYGHLLKDVNKEAANRLGNVIFNQGGSNMVANNKKGA